MKYIYCHPLFDERKCAHRFSYRLKKALEEKGLVLQRFDYCGTGEAPGEFADVSLQSLRADIVRQTEGDQVCLIGLRFGASLVLDYCVGGPGPAKTVVLIEPVVDGKTYVQYLRRKQRIKNLMTRSSGREFQDDGYENIEGYKTSAKFISQLENINLLDLAGAYSCANSVFIAGISNRQKVDPGLATLANSLQGKAQHVSVENFVLPIFWERIGPADCTELTTAIARWCCG